MSLKCEKRTRQILHGILWGFFVIYCLILIRILFLGRFFQREYSVLAYFRDFSNVIPFRTIMGYIKMAGRGFYRTAALNIVGNLLLFLPMGTMLPLLFGRINRFWKLAVTVLAAVILAELFQGFLRVGSIDIDDVICNLSGAMLGYPISKIPFLRKAFMKN